MRRGFNAIELTIVLVILLVLLALLLAGVQKVREAASRASCSNNLRSHAFAIHNYADTYNGRLPPGTMPNPALLPEQRLSFHVAVVPYVECSNVYSRVAQDEAWDSPTNLAAVADYTARLYQCPSGGGQKGEPYTLTGYLAVTNYVGVAGVGADAATRPADAPGIGMFGYDRTITLKDVKDGTPSTAMLIETAHDVGPWIRGGPSTVRAVEAGFGGTHRPGGFNVLLADASVRFVKPEIAPEVLAALATIAGGEEIPKEW